MIGRSPKKMSALQEKLGGDCPMIPDCDFSSLENTSQVLATALKDEKLNGLAYAVGSIFLPLHSSHCEGAS